LPQRRVSLTTKSRRSTKVHKDFFGAQRHLNFIAPAAQATFVNLCAPS
jgi:hypothetical protein